MIDAILATRPVRYGLRAALIADAAVAALVAQRIHNGTAPKGTALPYVVLSNPSQNDGGVFGQPGASGVWMLHAWSRSADEAERILGAVLVAVSGKVIATDLAHVTGVVDVLDVLHDPASTDSAPLFHGVAAYRWDALGGRS